MGIDVRIKNKKLIKKPLNLSDVVGSYGCGHMDDFFRLEEGAVEGTNVAYNPEHIGRGFEFYWKNDLKDEISLRLNFLSTIYDIEFFYQCIRNIMTVWGAKTFEQDGDVYRLEDIGKAQAIANDYNSRYLLMQDEMEEKYRTMVVLGAMNPVHFKCAELAAYVANNDLEGYAKKLHELQSADLYYAVPKVYRVNGKEFFGNYTVTSTVDTIFPIEASDPPLFKNPDTGEDLECSFFAVTLFSLEKRESIARISFDDFAKEIDINALPKYDVDHVILSGLSEERIMEIANKSYTDPLTGE